MNKINYDNLMQETLKGESGQRVLMHCCCGPCATSVCERVLESCKLALFWYNPNVQPQAEYEKRYLALKTVAEHFLLQIVQNEYDGEYFTDKVKGMESEREGGARCPVCFYIRLYATAVKAKELGYDYFCTTLTVSPHKNAEIINAIGQKIADEVGVKWLFSDFKKRGGYLRSTQLSNQLGLYRQNYCGCYYGRQGEN